MWCFVGRFAALARGAESAFTRSWMKATFAIGFAILGALASGCGGAADSGGSSNVAGDHTAGTANASAGASSGSGESGGAANGAGASSGGSLSAGATSSAGSPANGGSSTGAGGTAAGGSHTGGSGVGGALGVAGAPAGAAPLKGLAFNLNVNGSTCDDLKTLGLSWYYAWSGTAPCPGLEFVPQIWGSWKKLNWVPTPAKAVSKGAKYLLGFNEPDGTGQANMSVDEAIGLWPDFDQPGVLLGSPAVAGQEDWLPNFMTQAAAKKLRVDFIAVHWYGWNAGSCNDVSALEGKIKWAEQWQRPIWITEWSCRLQSPEVNQKFFADALVMLKKHPSVQRYAWFLSRSNGEFVNAALLDGGGKPTTLGSEYVAAPATH